MHAMMSEALFMHQLADINLIINLFRYNYNQHDRTGVFNSLIDSCHLHRLPSLKSQTIDASRSQPQLNNISNPKSLLKEWS